MLAEIKAFATLVASGVGAVVAKKTALVQGPFQWGAYAAATAVAAHYFAQGPCCPQSLKDEAAGTSAGRVAIVTGANSGIGYHTALELAELGFTVVITCRTLAKANAAATAMAAESQRKRPLDIRCFAMELDDFDSVKQFAKDFLATGLPLHILVNNAGMMAMAHTRSERHPDLEFHTSVNFFGPLLLSELLLKKIVQHKGRVVNVSSEAHNATHVAGSGDKLLESLDAVNTANPSGPLVSCNGFGRYGMSKLCNIYTAHYLAARGVTACALHPGSVGTQFGSRVFGNKFYAVVEGVVLRPLLFKSSYRGAQTTIYCCLCDERELAPIPDGGGAADAAPYFADCRPWKTHANAADVAHGLAIVSWAKGKLRKWMD